MKHLEQELFDSWFNYQCLKSTEILPLRQTNVVSHWECKITSQNKESEEREQPQNLKENH